MGYPSNSDGVAQDQIRAFVERIMRMREEAKAINDDIREIYAEAKANGFDKTVLGKVVIYVEKRATKAAEMLEAEAVFDLYLEAFDGATGTVNANAHAHEKIGLAAPALSGDDRPANTKAAPVSTPVTHAAGQGEGTAPGSLASTNPDGMASGSGEDPNAQSVSPRAAESVNAGGSDEAVTPLATDTVRAEAATPVASAPTAADQVRKQRPWCLHPDNLNQCAGHGKVHCHGCLKAHADAEGLSA